MGIKPAKAVLAENAGSICKPESYTDQKRDGLIIDKIKKLPEGEKLAAFLQDNGIKIKFSEKMHYAVCTARLVPKNGKWQFIEGMEKAIMLNPSHNDDLLAGCLFHEAHHARQYSDGMAFPAKQVSPYDLAWFTRMIEADAQANAVINAFRIKLDGDSAIFDAGKGVIQDTMYDAAEKRYAEDPSSLEDGRLKRMVFDAWFTEREKQNYDGGVVKKTGAYSPICLRHMKAMASRNRR